MESVAVARRRGASELSLYGIDLAVPVIKLKPIGDGAILPAVGDDPSPEGRGEKDEGRKPVDVVLDDCIALLHESDQRGVESDVRSDARSPESRQGLLVEGVDAIGDHLADVDPEQARRGRCHHDLSGPIGVGHPARRDG